jgi:radical SAM superfamily enzyme YgiQ (UPF0313 family)
VRVLLLTPPMTQLNTPYPATAYLTAFLRQQGFDARQADPALGLVLRLLSREGLTRVHEALRARTRAAEGEAVPHFLMNFDRYRDTVEPAIRFLQGKDPSLAVRIAGRRYLPEGPRFAALAQMGAVVEDPEVWAFGALGVQDQAKFLASLYLDDLADVIREGVDERFQFSRYGEKLAASAPSFDGLAQALAAEPTLVDRMLDELAEALLLRERPEFLGLTAPFPGNVYGALRIARVARRVLPGVRIAFGGGYPNTELRELAEPRVFDYFDYITLDDGERPLLCALEHATGRREDAALKRTFVRRDGRVVWCDGAKEHEFPQKDLPAPTYDGLPLGDYLSIFEMLNPMHRLWSDGRWNKLTLAHGCYWKKCNFCDVTLDYIGRYDPAPAQRVVDRMEALARETGQSGFHFVDEAAPPAMLRAISEEILKRGLTFTWWGNVRFERAFTPELAQLMARAGCIAVSGGLEVASDRLLKLMNKGVTVEQVARVTRALTDAGILVHAYLMYGFPTQTEAETVDALERVRQLFAEGCIQSAYWHRFSAPVHSPIGRDPAAFGIRLEPVEFRGFAKNDVPFVDPSGVDHDALGEGLRRALYNYMHGIGLEFDVRQWFDGPVPKARVPKDLIARALSGEPAARTPAGEAAAQAPAGLRRSGSSRAPRSKRGRVSRK